MKLKNWTNTASYLFTIAASIYIIVDRHSYEGASGLSVWAGIAIIIIGLFGYKRLGVWSVEWGLVQQGHIMVKTFRRPFFAGVYIYGSLIGALVATSWFMDYVERNLVSLSATLQLMAVVAVIGYTISFVSLIIPIKKSG
jgi:hypothetical protein